MTDCTYNTDMDAWNNVFSTNETASGIEITSTDACFYNQEMSTVINVSLETAFKEIPPTAYTVS